MNSQYKILVSGIILLISISCGTKKNLTYNENTTIQEQEILDTLVISDLNNIDSLPKIYRPSAALTYDILHTKLELKFDWAQQHVLGKAYLNIQPYFKDINIISLDAVGFDIHQVQLQPENSDLHYDYDGSKLNITLDRYYSKNEKLNLFIDYTAKPNENKISTGDAITSDKGLFFIDPLDNDPDVPTQIWTQGETQNNSRWFPTFDKPNERFTQEIILTVDNRYLTLSNGRKVSSRKNEDGTRTDHWKQDKPHAPYLAMIAVGEFHEEMDEWNKIPLHYIVEKGFGKHAKKIFNHTPEMLSFFSDKLKYPYPWDKYGQIVVRDFVSGAMENTSAVVFSDQVQKTDRELIDNDNDYIIAHEMMHHWFGDLVTCEDWSNLTLNEGFANYAEYLWFEHKYGRDRAEYHRMNEMNGYYGQVFGGGAHPLIHYYYEDKEHMFDAHSYNKGGLVLHMLRNYLGDEGFFAGLNKYLRDHAYSAVEVDELRMAFEDTIGEDLHWFFDQWFHGNGHPYIDVKYTYNQANKVLLVETDLSDTPSGFYKNFRIPTDIALYYADGSVSYHPVVIDEIKNRFLIENLDADPITYVFDGRNVLLAMINENKSTDQFESQFLLSPNFMDKMIGFTSVADKNYDMLQKALKEKFYVLRIMGINAIADSIAYQYVDILQDMVIADPHSEVRKEALEKLFNIENFDPTTLCKLVLNTEKAYPVLEIALEAMAQLDDSKKDEYFRKFKDDESDYLVSTLVGMMDQPTDENLRYLETKSSSIQINYMFDFYAKYQEFLSGKNIEVLDRSVDHLSKIAANKDGNMYRKYLAMTTLIKIAEDLSKRNNNDTPKKALLNKVSSNINNIAKNETNPTLIEKYEGIR